MVAAAKPEYVFSTGSCSDHDAVRVLGQGDLGLVDDLGSEQALD